MSASPNLIFSDKGGLYNPETLRAIELNMNSTTAWASSKHNIRRKYLDFREKLSFIMFLCLID